MPGIDAQDSVLSYLTVEGASTLETIEAAATAGFGAATIRVIPTGAAGVVAAEVSAMADVANTVAAARSAGIEIADVEYVNLTPSWSREEWRPVVEAGAELGARQIVVMGTDPDEDRLTESYAALCALAAEAEMRAMIEFSAYSEVKSLAQACRIATGVESPAAGVIVDALHLFRSGGDAAGVAAVVSSRPRLFPALHLCDAPLLAPDPSPDGLAAESRGNRLLPGDGELPLADLLVALPAARRYVEAPVRANAAAPFVARAEAAAAALRGLPGGERCGALRH